MWKRENKRIEVVMEVGGKIRGKRGYDGGNVKVRENKNGKVGGEKGYKGEMVGGKWVNSWGMKEKKMMEER